MKKTKSNLLLMTLIILTIISVILIIYLGLTEEKYNYLTQFGNQSSTQMMGYVLKTRNGKIIAIDGGRPEDTNNFKDYIYENGGKVDYWFLTHNHNDHASVFVNIVKNTNIEIGKVYVSLNDKEWYMENEWGRQDFSIELIDTLNSDKVKDKVVSPKLNDTFEIDDIKVEILGIRNPEITENPGNEQSMVIKFDTGKTSLLILGDTGEKSSKKLLANQKDKLKCDIVQMAHHGQAGATKELYQAVKPSICLWPTPEWLWNNDSGEGYNTGSWKTLETRAWMEELGVKENYIEKDGNITIKLK
ncbi:MAG: MBL fold metallo-hydrolase [Clostridia bacterium]|nr:MBL fold metallo-hydrolase [Clostridia bacterium]